MANTNNNSSFWVFSAFVAVFIGNIVFNKGKSDFDNPNSRHECECEYEYNGETLKLEKPQKREEQIVDEILFKVGVKERPFNLCRVKKIPGDYAIAFATHIKGKFFIIYDATVFKSNSLNQARYAMAHEVGHLVQGHYTERSVHSHKKELEANYFSGRILFSYGLTKQETVDLVSEGREATDKHPSGVLVRQALAEGWINGSRNIITTEPTKEYEPKTRPLSLGPAPSKVNHAEVTVRDFIHALGEQDFSKAYSLQEVESWGARNFFASKRSFGGITETKILAKPKLIECYRKAGDGSCLNGKVYVQYYAKDPVNDECETGKVYMQSFWVAKIDNRWKITKAKTSYISCH